jgi:hypothetical protein
MKEKIEGYLIKLSMTYEEVGDNIWLITDEEKGLGHVVVFSEESLLTVRAKIMEVPDDNLQQFYEQLLTLNATDMVHGAYALENNNVVIIDTLELETMDIEELQASLDAIGLAVAQHYPILSKFRNK